MKFRSFGDSMSSTVQNKLNTFNKCWSDMVEFQCSDYKLSCSNYMIVYENV